MERNEQYIEELTQELRREVRGRTPFEQSLNGIMDRVPSDRYYDSLRSDVEKRYRELSMAEATTKKKSGKARRFVSGVIRTAENALGAHDRQIIHDL